MSRATLQHLLVLLLTVVATCHPAAAALADSLPASAALLQQPAA